MRRAIRRLRLKQGDIVVVETMETCNRLKAAASSMPLPKGVTYVPILMAPEGIRKVSLAKLKKMVARMEREELQAAEQAFGEGK